MGDGHDGELVSTDAMQEVAAAVDEALRTDRVIVLLVRTHQQQSRQGLHDEAQRTAEACVQKVFAQREAFRRMRQQLAAWEACYPIWPLHGLMASFRLGGQYAGDDPFADDDEKRDH